MTRDRSTGAVNALVLGGAHAVVDGVSGFVLFRYLALPGVAVEEVITGIVVYDMLAFAMQAPLGLLLDRWPARRGVALAGLGGLALALATAPVAPRTGVVIAGVANALFHVAAGAHVLGASKGRAREIGLFVGPGAIGLSLGILLGRSLLPGAAGLALALALAALVVARSVPRGLRPSVRRSRLEPAASTRLALACCSLLLLTVVVRSLAGDTLAYGWRERSAGVVLALAVAASVGKMLGGVVADRLGWASSAGVALLLAAPLAALGLRGPAAAVTGMLLLQSTMPLTLKAVHLILQDRPALAFGLASAALLLGALPGLVSVWPLDAGPLLAGVIGLSALAVVTGLGLLNDARASVARLWVGAPGRIAR